MIDLTAQQIATITQGRCGQETSADVVVNAEAVIDSRKVIPGSLFVALPGENTDGHDYAPQAISAGAALVLSTREVGVPCVIVDDVAVALGRLAAHVLSVLRQSGGITVFAITGSVGKTTTKDLLAGVLEQHGPTISAQASFNNEIGLPLTVLRANASTKYLVLEMGASAAGEIAYLTGIAPPDISIVLCVGTAHIGGFGDIDKTAKAKSEIVTGLLPTGTAILNADDPRVRAMTELAPTTVFFGERDGRIRASNVTMDEYARACFTVSDESTGQQCDVALSLIGEHQITNALAVIAACRSIDLPLEDVCSEVGALSARSGGRMELTERPDGVIVINDAYNANPDSMRAALKTLAIMGRHHRTWAVLGEMLELGPDSVREHDALGRLAVRLDIPGLIVVGVGAKAIHQGAVHEGSWGQESRYVDTIEDAEELLGEVLRPGDVVLIKSSLGSGLLPLGRSLAGTDNQTRGEEVSL